MTKDKYDEALERVMPSETLRRVFKDAAVYGVGMAEVSGSRFQHLEFDPSWFDPEPIPVERPWWSDPAQTARLWKHTRH